MEIRQHLLQDTIIASNDQYKKYSKCFMNMKNIFVLEGSQIKDENIIEHYKDLLRLFNDFHDGVPLRIMEENFYRYITDFKKIYVPYHNAKQRKEISIEELYLKLEEFYDRVFFIAVSIADKYSYEIPFKKGKSEEIVFK